MNKFVKTFSTAGAVALILSGAAWADPPVTDGFGKWSVNGSGNIVYNYTNHVVGDTTCPLGFTCGTAVTGAGFSQRQITDASGNKYFQTVVTPETAVSVSSSAVSFADESFVKVGVTGISSNQRASDTAVSGIETTDFNTSTAVNTGWASGGTYKDLQVAQSVAVTNNKGTGSAEVTMYNGFTFNQNGTTTAPTGKYMDITQGVLLTSGADLTTNTDDDVQKFVMREASGNLNGAAHTLGSVSGGLLPGASTTDVAWSATDDVKVTYVGQQMVQSGVEAFRFQFYDNLTSASADSISNFEVGSSAPWTWVQPFGASAPAMTVP